MSRGWCGGDGAHAPALDRRLSPSDRPAALELWRCVAGLRADLAAMCAAGVMVLAGGSSPDGYAAIQAEVRERLALLAHRIDRRELRRRDAERRQLALAIGDLIRTARDHAGAPPEDADSLWAHVLGTYWISRELGSHLWAFDLRPEGRPLLPEAFERYLPVEAWAH